MSKRAPQGLGLVLLLHMKCKGKFWLNNETGTIKDILTQNQGCSD